jgi:hypothetical protein
MSDNIGIWFDKVEKAVKTINSPKYNGSDLGKLTMKLLSQNEDISMELDIGTKYMKIIYTFEDGTRSSVDLETGDKDFFYKIASLMIKQSNGHLTIKYEDPGLDDYIKKNEEKISKLSHWLPDSDYEY